MSCRRSDTRELKGCRIGDVALRGCSRGCCPYSDAEMTFHIRNHLFIPSRTYAPEYRDRYSETSRPPGREGLHYKQCMSSYRPKFICAKPGCRRSIKPVFDEERFEYRISDFQDWEVRPRREREKRLDDAYRNHVRIRSRGLEMTEEKKEFDELWRRYRDAEKGESEMSKEDMEKLKTYEPELWWNTVIKIPRSVSMIEEHKVRCPSCGEGAMRVGSSFRVPKKGDEKAWKQIEEMIRNGVGMVAAFSVCWTVEEHEEVVEEAQMRWGKKETQGAWEEEKRRRIEALGLKSRQGEQ